MPFYEDYQMIANQESYDLYHTNPSYRDVINYVYAQTTPSLFTGVGQKHHALDFYLLQNNHIFNTNEDNDVTYMVGYSLNPLHRTFIISALYVHPDYRRKGIASKLLKHFQDDVCRDRAIIIASVDPLNQGVIDLFRSAGFVSPLPITEPDDLGYRYLEMLWSQRKFKAWHDNRMLYAEFID